MRILFALPYVPSSIRVRPYSFIRELAKRHEVDVLAVGSDADAPDVDRLREFCRSVEVVTIGRATRLMNCALAALRGESLQASVCRSRVLAARLNEAIGQRNHDVVHVEHLRAAHVASLIPSTVPSLFDAVDSISLLLERTLRQSHSLEQRALARLEIPRVRSFEGRSLTRFDQVAVTSPVDAAALRSLAPTARIAVVPNGVDLEHFHPRNRREEAGTLVFTGKMSYHANASAVHYFVKEILPIVRQTHPEVRLVVAGSSPPPSVVALARGSAITVTGRVGDMRVPLGQAAVAICPMTVKVGIQNKVLEAMSMSIPVVSTVAGAEGLVAADELELLVAGSPAGFAAHVCRLFDDPRLRDEIGRNGRRYVERNHRWDAAARRLEGLYAAAIDLHRPVASLPDLHSAQHAGKGGQP